MPPEDPPGLGPGLETLLEYLKAQRGFDFTGYKRSTIERRVAKRMEAVGAADVESYLDHLEVHQDEFAHLFNTILINVTSFYRDPEAWEFVTTEVLPALLAAKGPDEPIRVWSAGCASGEETYTIAMVLAEALGEAEYLRRVKIYATDVDDDALDAARLATFDPKQVEALPAHLAERWLVRSDTRYTFHKDLRRTIIFGRNDLVQDAPISRVDLLVCRNTLMYFNAETQSRILARFHFALNLTGFLFMGKSEMLSTHAELFKPVNLKRRVFQKVARRTLRDQLIRRVPAAPLTNGLDSEPDDEAVSPLLVAALEAAPQPTLVLDGDDVLVLANAAARTLLNLRADDVGRPLRDLEVSYRPIELRTHIDEVRSTGRAVTVAGIGFRTADEARVVDLKLTPLVTDGIAGVSIVYSDVTAARRLKDELERSKQELEHSYEELQSTVEELETTNEELQSTNEELETMNEELQSTNEELQTINDELRERTAQLDEVNAFLETILRSLKLSVVVLDRQLQVQIWNALSTELWGLRPEEVEGEHFLGLDIGLPVDELKGVLRACLDGRTDREELVVAATNRRGRPIECDVTALPMHAGSDHVTGVILLMQELSPERLTAATVAGA